MNRYVAVNGSDQYGLGTEKAPWQSISKALSMSFSGDDIHVGEGTYIEEPVTLMKNGQISIQGNGIVKVENIAEQIWINGITQVVVRGIEFSNPAYLGNVLRPMPVRISIGGSKVIRRRYAS